MIRVGFLLFCMALFSCKDKKANEGGVNGFSYESFSGKFRKSNLPYQLADTALIRNTDTSSIRTSDLSQFITDSLKNKLFGKSAKIRYIPLYKLEKPKSEIYYIVKALSPFKKVAFLLLFSGNGQFHTVFPFLIQDNDPSTSQISSIDKSFSVSKSLIRRASNGVLKESKEVYQYNSQSNKFSLIMTDATEAINNNIINPIDSFPHKRKFTGDYIKDKKNFISIRDGRHVNQLLAFIHFEKDVDCQGELKGDLLLTSQNTAIFRQGGDPCVLSFRFFSSSVSIKEEQGCGSHRGVNCVFEGNFPLKKPVKSKLKTKRIVSG